MAFLEQISRWSSDWGVRLAAFAGTVAGVATANQEILVALIGILPNGPARLFIAIGAAVAVFGVPTLTQIIQDKIKENAGGQSVEQPEAK